MRITKEHIDHNNRYWTFDLEWLPHSGTRHLIWLINHRDTMSSLVINDRVDDMGWAEVETGDADLVDLIRKTWGDE